MHFLLTDEQTEVQALARKILEDYCSNEQLRQFDEGERFNPTLWNELATAGLLGIAIDEQYGGMGFSFETLCLLAEEVGRTVAPVPMTNSLVIGALGIQRYAPESLKNKVLPGVANGKLMLTSAIAEQGNYDFAPSELQAKKSDSGWVLNGEKQFVPFAAISNWILVSASTESGAGLFLIEPSLQGLTQRPQTSTSGESQSCLRFDNVAVPAESAFAIADAAAFNFLENAAFASLSSQALGLCDVMMRTSASYTSEREQFGVKIATFQAVGQRAADCYIDVECLRGVTQQAVYSVDVGNAADEDCLIAKIWAGDALHRISHAAQHLHGGMGVDRDYPLWRYCIWAKHLELQLGSSARLTERLGDSIAEAFKASA